MKRTVQATVALFMFLFFTNLYADTYEVDFIDSCRSNKVYLPDENTEGESGLKLTEQEDPFFDLTLYTYSKDFDTKVHLGILLENFHGTKNHIISESLSKNVIKDKTEVRNMIDMIDSLNLIPGLLPDAQDHILSIKSIEEFSGLVPHSDNLTFLKFKNDKGRTLGQFMLLKHYFPMFFVCN